MPVESRLRIVTCWASPKSTSSRRTGTARPLRLKKPATGRGRAGGRHRRGSGRNSRDGAPVQGAGGAAHVEDYDLQARHRSDRWSGSGRGAGAPAALDIGRQVAAGNIGTLTAALMRTCPVTSRMAFRPTVASSEIAGPLNGAEDLLGIIVASELEIGPAADQQQVVLLRHEPGPLAQGVRSVST